MTHPNRIPLYILLAITALFYSCTSDSWHRESGAVWSTLYNISWRGPQRLRDSIMPALSVVDRSLSVFNDSSLVVRVNDSLATPVDAHFIRVYNESRKIWRASGGMFDPTLSPAITAWGFGKGHKATADTLRCDSLAAIVGLGKTSLKGSLLVKRDIRTKFNFSALAKGYGCDLIAEMFRRNGVSDFLIEIGGEIVCSGHNDRGEAWNIAIDNPSWGAPAGGKHIDLISISDMAVATSGNYRNFHGSGASAYGHTISPTDCRPAATDILSATVVAPDCIEADALATACMALGSARAKALCDSLHAPLMLVLSDSTLYYSDSFRALRARTLK